MSDVLMPQMGESIAEGTIVRWMKGVGDTVDKDEPLFEISTDKVDAEIPSPDAGVITEIRVREGETVPVHTVVATISGATAAAGTSGTSGAATGAPAAVSSGIAAAPLPSVAQQRPVASESVFLSPVVKKMVAAHGLDLTGITGSGAAGRITKRDVDAYMAGAPKATPAATPTAARPALYQPGDDVRVEKMSVMRRKIADHMLTSLRTSAHIYSTYEIDFGRVSELRTAHKARYEADGANLTYTAVIAHAVAATLRECPYANASVDGDQIVFRNEINLGIAVALEQGLIVPVVRHADRKTLKELCVSISDLAQRARNKQLKVEDVEGGTFTITNPGIFGGIWGLPIISQPQVAILAVGSIDKRAVVIDDQVVVRPMAYFTLGYDHRLIDGADGGRFLQALKRRLEDYDETQL
jgi:pyruvate dehydrogenase E2 component (dihydrolipoamide acetyltransferase)